LGRLQKTADVTWYGKPFQTRAAATGKARSPMVDSHVRIHTAKFKSVIHYSTDPTGAGVNVFYSTVTLTLTLTDDIITSASGASGNQMGRVPLMEFVERVRNISSTVYLAIRFNG